MIKQSLYPKTPRAGNGSLVYITEKLDGSNLCFFRHEGELYVAQRNNIFKWSKDMSPAGLYKGLYQWLLDNADSLDLCEGSVICGEWLGMGHIKYTDLPHRFYMFAKANVHLTLSSSTTFELTNINYYHEFFKFPFESQIIPECIGIIPLVAHNLTEIPSIDFLDNLYDTYQSESKVEGFIVIINNKITKYVRFKDGKPSEHKS